MNTEILARAVDAELEDWGSLPEATDHPMATHGMELWVGAASSDFAVSGAFRFGAQRRWAKYFL